MPTLKQLTCSVEWRDSGEPLPEYQTTYTDGYVESFIAVPSDPTPFAVRLRSSGYVAPGLSMFVYMDGVYQCNRNRQNLKFPDGEISEGKMEVNFRVCQKEESLKTGGFRGKEWKFEKVKIASDPDIEASERAPHDGEYVGTIEVVVLRCFSSDGRTSSLKSVETLVNGKTSSFSHKVSKNDDVTPGGTMNDSSKPKPKPTQRPRPRRRPQVFGLNGTLDGSRSPVSPIEESKKYFRDWASPVSPIEGSNKDSRDWKRPPSPTVGSAWDKPSSSQERKGGPITATGSKSGTYHPVAESSKSKQAGSQQGSSVQTRSLMGQQAPLAAQLRGGGPGSYSASSHHGSARGSPVVVNVYNGIGAAPPLTNGPPPARDWTTEGKALDAAKPSGNSAAKFDPWLDAPVFDSSKDTHVNKGDPDPNDKVDSWNAGGQDVPGGWGASNDQQNDNGGWGASGDKTKDNSAAWDNAGKASDWDKTNDDDGKEENGWNASSGKGKEKADDGWGHNSEENRNEGTGNDGWGNDNNNTHKGDSWENNETKDIQQDNDWNANNGEPNQQNDTWNTDNAEPVAEVSAAGEQDKGKNDKSQKGQKSPDNKKKGKGPKGSKGPKAGSAGKAGTAKSQAASNKPKIQSPTRVSLKSAMKKSTEAPPGSPAASKKSSVKPGEWSPRLGPARDSPKTGEPSASQAQPIFSSLSETPKSKAYWSSWNEPPVKHKPPIKIPRSFPAAEDPLYIVSADVARRNSMSHQVRLGHPLSYTHKVSVPRYIDSHEDPYAVFIFQYRNKEVVEQMLNITIAEPEVDEKARLASLSKAELVEEVLKTKEKLSSQGVLQGNPGGSPGSSDKATFKSNPHGIAMGPNAEVLSERLSKLASSKEDTPKMVGAWVDETPAAEENGNGHGNENDTSGAWGGNEDKNDNKEGDSWGSNENNGSGNGEASTKANENGNGGGGWGNNETGHADAKTQEENKKDSDTGGNGWGTADEKKDENAGGDESGKKHNNGADDQKDNSWAESGFGALGDWPENEEEKKEKANGSGNGNGGAGDSWGDNAGGDGGNGGGGGGW